MLKRKSNQEFRGASRYVLDDELAKIVNISMALEMPLLLKGEPVDAGGQHRLYGNRDVDV